MMNDVDFEGEKREKGKIPVFSPSRLLQWGIFLRALRALSG
jgi:hypothetical protein